LLESIGGTASVGNAISGAAGAVPVFSGGHRGTKRLVPEIAAAAREWCSQFAPVVVFTSAPVVASSARTSIASFGSKSAFYFRPRISFAIVHTKPKAGKFSR
jgi:hypothetical protein